MPSEYKGIKLTTVAEGILGHCARLISGSKSLYRDKYPDHVVFFNANIFTKEDGKIWYGDIDLSIDEPKLKRLAYELTKEVFLLDEMSGRFESETKIGSQVEKDAIWSSARGPLNWFKKYIEEKKYKRTKGKWLRNAV